ncbi:hypothetical protein [Mastigocladopsis repens]|uniref:hypothetical protein n=1 Tax=Mastigocladopsis repens TaxID=221287 RepID=UPI0002FC8352|nr:hypothetical protein [Mastigocladopsis repens]
MGCESESGIDIVEYGSVKKSSLLRQVGEGESSGHAAPTEAGVEKKGLTEPYSDRVFLNRERRSPTTPHSFNC